MTYPYPTVRSAGGIPLIDRDNVLMVLGDQGAADLGEIVKRLGFTNIVELGPGALNKLHALIDEMEWVNDIVPLSSEEDVSPRYAISTMARLEYWTRQLAGFVAHYAASRSQE